MKRKSTPTTDPKLPTGSVKQKITRAFERSLMPALAQKYLTERKENQKIALPPPLTIWECFDRDQRFERPIHLTPYVEMLHTALDSLTQVVFSTPPQCSKTTTALMALVFYSLTRSGLTHFYITYNETRATDVRKTFCTFLDKQGIKYEGGNHLLILGGSDNGGTTVHFTSINGSVTGYSCTGIAFVDDPVKGDDAAQSPTQRDTAWKFMTNELFTRENERMAIVAMMTRWHTDDISGRLIDKGWPYINLPAICDSEADPLGRTIGEPLWPTKHPLDQLARVRANVGEVTWYAMYQGDPFPIGERIFSQPATFKNPHPADHRQVVAYGLDLAYSEHKRSDWSVIVRLIKDVKTGDIHVDRVIRRQVRVDTFLIDIRMLVNERPGQVMWFTGGQEKGIADLIRKAVPQLVTLPALKAKVVRAMDVAAAWNAGHVSVPEHQDHHMQNFILNVTTFTGDGDLHDDDVDALTGGFEALKGSAGVNHFGRNQLIHERMQNTPAGKAMQQRRFI